MQGQVTLCDIYHGARSPGISAGSCSVLERTGVLAELDAHLPARDEGICEAKAPPTQGPLKKHSIGKKCYQMSPKR